MTAQHEGERGPEELSGDLHAIEQALGQGAPMLRVIDRGLVLPGGARAELVALEECGRLVLVQCVDGKDDACLSRALDLLAEARENLALIGRHADAPGLRGDLEPRLLLVTRSWSRSLRRRLEPLLGGALSLMEVREITSAMGEGAYLVPIEAAPLGPHGPGSATEGFLDLVPDEQRGLAGRALSLLARVGDETSCALVGDELQWGAAGSPLCHLGVNDGRMFGRVSGEGPRALDSPGDLEAFLEAALERYLELVEEGADAELAEVPGVEIVPHDPGVLLTPEELEAFRD